MAHPFFDKGAMRDRIAPGNRVSVAIHRRAGLEVIDDAGRTVSRGVRNVGSGSDMDLSADIAPDFRLSYIPSKVLLSGAWHEVG
jgi:hypothetical protein